MFLYLGSVHVSDQCEKAKLRCLKKILVNNLNRYILSSRTSHDFLELVFHVCPSKREGHKPSPWLKVAPTTQFRMRFKFDWQPRGSGTLRRENKLHFPSIWRGIRESETRHPPPSLQLITQGSPLARIFVCLQFRSKVTPFIRRRPSFFSGGKTVSFSLCNVCQQRAANASFMVLFSIIWSA